MKQLVGFGDRSTGRGILANLGRATVTNGDFTAYVYDSAATRPSSQITLGRLVLFTGHFSQTAASDHWRRSHRSCGDMTPPLLETKGAGGHNLEIIHISHVALITPLH